MSAHRPVLLVGYSPTLLAEFGRFLPDGGLVVLEEPDAVRKRGARAVAEPAAVCRELIEEEFLLPGGADRFYVARPDLDPVAVIPAHEYAVPAAARIAERYGAPGAGLGAAQVLRDKHLLRVVASAAGVPNPASREVGSAAEVAMFQTELGGPVIIKPANRQAALGAQVVTDPARIPAAWQECLDLDQEDCLPDRAQELRMLVEQFVDGAEYSVEMLYSAGVRVFANVTAKVLHGGSRPVEVGHLVPAPIPPDLAELMIGQTERLLAAIGFGVGLVHCEWIVQDGTPFLVECAGRQPGDYILELIRDAYSFDLYRTYVELMTGELPQAPTVAVGGAATWHGISEPGEVISVDGVAEAAALPGVQKAMTLVKVGDAVRPLRSSWDRTVAVTALAESAATAGDTARRAVELISVSTKQQ
ncbi:MAG TPA: ATP-grasp domain-containing protein [Micromonosporaceae bacterium]|nr:ATP-grasp domain-containing protein [Micromonosporaceae bacterium]